MTRKRRHVTEKSHDITSQGLEWSRRIKKSLEDRVTLRNILTA